MLFIHVARILEWIFFVGLAGSLVVSVAAFVGDLHVFFEKNEGPPGQRDGATYPPGAAAAHEPPSSR